MSLRDDMIRAGVLKPAVVGVLSRMPPALDALPFLPVDGVAARAAARTVAEERALDATQGSRRPLPGLWAPRGFGRNG